jgi:peroxiredoxin
MTHMTKLPVLAALATSLFAAQLPRPASEFVLKMVTGPDQLLSAYKGKTIVLAFMYATCPHCQKTAGVLSQLQTEYAAKGVQVVGVLFDNDDSRRVADFRRTYAKNFPVAVSDTGTVLNYLQHPPTEPYFVPDLVFIDKKYNIRSQYLGDEKFLEKQDINIRAEIDKLLKGVATTTSSATPPKPPKS